MDASCSEIQAELLRGLVPEDKPSFGRKDGRETSPSAEEEGTKRIQESDHGSVAYVQASDAVQLARSGEYHRRILLHFHKVQKAASLATIV
jgi:hypothetical protein